MAVGGLAFGSVPDKVCNYLFSIAKTQELGTVLTLPRFLPPMRTEMRLSLRSLSSFFFSFSAFSLTLSASFVSRRCSFSDLASLFSCSDCKLLRELEPRRMDGKPRLRTEDFLTAVPGVAGEDRLASVGVETVDLTRSRVDGFRPGDKTVGDVPFCSPELCTCGVCDDERRKNGIEDGVSRLDAPRRREDDGLSGVCAGARPPLAGCPLVLVRGGASSSVVKASDGGTARLAAIDGVEDFRTEPMEESEPKEIADAMASG
jgi:hypothetical protein